MSDLDVATVEELHPELSTGVQNLRALGMGWAWRVSDLSKYLPDAEALADMTLKGDDAMGISPEIPLQDIVLEAEDARKPQILTLWSCFSTCRSWTRG